MRERLAGFNFVPILKFLSRLPLPVLYALSDVLYVVVYHIWRFRRQLSRTNIRNSFPDKPAAEVEVIARQSYRNACHLIAEVLKGATIGSEELRDRVRIENLSLLAPWFKARQPVVLLASHHCNWEWLLQASCIELGLGVDAVYKPLRVSAVDRFMHAARSRFGGNPIPVKNFLMEVLKRRQGAHVIALVADQTPLANEEKHWTQFLGQDTAFFVGADKIARILKAPVFFVGMNRTGRGRYQAVLTLLCEPPYSRNGTDIIERYARVAERHIAAYPADWLWMYRKWKYRKPLYA